jgi:TRAP-type uncharacterized transport system substrate-binding protein
MRGLRAFFFGSAILLACASLAILGSYFALQPTMLRIAIPSNNLVDLRIFGAAAELLRSQRTSIRLEFVTKESSAEAQTALDRRDVHLAVLRSDLAGQGNAQTVLILRTEAGIFLAPKGGKVQKFTDLAKGTLGVVREGPADGSLLPHVLDYYGVPVGKISLVILKTEDVAAALRDKRVDAIAAVGPVASKLISDVVSEAGKGSKAGLTFINIEEADAIAKRVPALESIDIDQGAFGGRPPRPAEAFSTLGVTMRLVAHDKVDNEAIAELAKQLINSRQQLHAAVPGANLIRAPDLEEDTNFLIHPGARIYVNGEQKNFFDRYSDWLYLGLFVGSFAGSIVTGFLSWTGSQARRDNLACIIELEAALHGLREARTLEQVDAVERQADQVFRTALSAAVRGELDTEAIATFEMALADARHRITTHRQRLLEAPVKPRAKAVS